MARTRRGDAAKSRPRTGSSRPAPQKGRRRATPSTGRNSTRGGSAAGCGAQVGEGTARAICRGRQLGGHRWATGAGEVPTRRAAAATHRRREAGGGPQGASQAARSTEQRVGPQKESAQTGRGATQVTLARGGAGAKRHGDTTRRAQRRRRGGNSGRERKSLLMRPVGVERRPTGSGGAICRHCLAHPPPLLAAVAATQCSGAVGRCAGRPPPPPPPPFWIPS